MDAWTIKCPRPARYEERQGGGHYPEELGPDSLVDTTVAQHVWYIYWLLRKRDDRAVRLDAFEGERQRVIELALKVEALEGELLRLGIVGRIVDKIARFFRGPTPEEA